MSPCLTHAIIDLSGPTLFRTNICVAKRCRSPLQHSRKLSTRAPHGLRRGTHAITATHRARRLSKPKCSMGGRLYDELIPQELSDALRRDTGASNLIMYLDPACSWIPWELLWDGEEFLCRRFRLGRLYSSPAKSCELQPSD